MPVSFSRIGHELAELVHDEGNVRPSPAGDEVGESNEAYSVERVEGGVGQSVIPARSKRMSTVVA